MLESGFDGGLGAETDWLEGKRERGERGDSDERQLFVHFGTARGQEKGQGLEGMSVWGWVHFKKMVGFKSGKEL